MIKKLARVGNSKALVLDKTTLDHLGITKDEVQLTLSGSNLIVSAVTARHATDKEFRAAADHIGKKYKELFRRLA